jgi:hypothetical protein
MLDVRHRPRDLVTSSSRHLAISRRPRLAMMRSSLPPRRRAVRRWDDVPPPSEDFARADDTIRRHVMELMDELVRAAGAKKD